MNPVCQLLLLGSSQDIFAWGNVLKHLLCTFFKQLWFKSLIHSELINSERKGLISFSCVGISSTFLLPLSKIYWMEVCGFISGIIGDRLLFWFCERVRAKSLKGGCLGVYQGHGGWGVYGCLVILQSWVSRAQRVAFWFCFTEPWCGSISAWFHSKNWEGGAHYGSVGVLCVQVSNLTHHYRDDMSISCPHPLLVVPSDWIAWSSPCMGVVAWNCPP